MAMVHLLAVGRVQPVWDNHILDLAVVQVEMVPTGVDRSIHPKRGLSVGDSHNPDERHCSNPKMIKSQSMNCKFHIYIYSPADVYPLKLDCSHGRPERRERGTIDEVAAIKEINKKNQLVIISQPSIDTQTKVSFSSLYI